MVLDLVCLKSFHYLTEAWVKMSLFSELIWAHLCVLITKKKDILILGKSPTQGLDDTTIIHKIFETDSNFHVK